MKKVIFHFLITSHNPCCRRNTALHRPHTHTWLSFPEMEIEEKEGGTRPRTKLEALKRFIDNNYNKNRILVTEDFELQIV